MDTGIIVKLALLSACVLPVIGLQECQDQADIVFLVDSSLSIRESNPRDGSEDNWQIVKDFISYIVTELPIDTGDIRVGVAIFSTDVDMAQMIHFNDHEPGEKDQLIQRIKDLQYYPGNTNTSGALWVMRDQLFNTYYGDRSGVRDLCVLITDGLSNIDKHRTIPEARQAKNEGVRIYSIGITEYADGDELEDIASDPVNYHYMLAKNFAHLTLFVDQLLGRICYSKPPPPMPCRDARADVVFLLDNSGSIAEKDPAGQSGYNWGLVKDFVTEVINNLEVGYFNTRIAIIRFSTSAEIMLKLNELYEAYEVIKKVRDLEFRYGGTNTSGALRTMREEVFKVEFGDRPDVRNIGIIITDGESTTDREYTIDEAMKTHRAHIQMFAVGLTKFLGEKELHTIATEPVLDHYFNTTEIHYVETLVSRLVWGVCNSRCTAMTAEERAKDELCGQTNQTACPEGKYRWIYEPGKLLIGHNYARVQHVETPAECQRICLKDPYCKSVDYVDGVDECAVSYVTRNDAPESYASDPGVDYYELDCLVGRENDDEDWEATTKSNIYKRPVTKDRNSGGSGGTSNGKKQNIANQTFNYYSVVFITIISIFISCNRT